MTFDFDGREIKSSVYKIEHYIALEPIPIDEETSSPPNDLQQNRLADIDAVIEDLSKIMPINRTQENIDAFGNEEFLFEREENEVYITEALNLTGPVANSVSFNNANAEEIKGIIQGGVFKATDEEDLSDDAKVFWESFDLTLKSVVTPNGKPKARYTAQKSLDVDKERMLHNLSTMKQRSTRMITSFAAIGGHRIFFNDIKQACLQSEAPFAVDVYFKPRNEDWH